MKPVKVPFKLENNVKTIKIFKVVNIVSDWLHTPFLAGYIDKRQYLMAVLN